MLLLDRVDSVEPGVRATAVKSVSRSEPWFQGHFPEYAVLPGVIVVEALAQLAGVLVSTESRDSAVDGAGSGFTFLAGLRNMRFRRPVIPGDQLMLVVERTAGTASVGEYHGFARVDGSVAVEGVLTLAVAGAVRR
jgi:3-hydroxyacyl-[acyl-carrier-protein] dehydratase